VYPVALLTFDIAFTRVDRDHDPTIVEGFLRTVEWPALPHEGEGIDLGNELDPVAIESVGNDFNGYPNVFMGRVVLDDLQAAQLRKLGWRVKPLPFSRRWALTLVTDPPHRRP
jgi:hypothetical protein